jgi:hypothetical protein
LTALFPSRIGPDHFASDPTASHRSATESDARGSGAGCLQRHDRVVELVSDIVARQLVEHRRQVAAHDLDIAGGEHAEPAIERRDAPAAVVDEREARTRVDTKTSHARSRARSLPVNTRAISQRYGVVCPDAGRMSEIRPDTAIDYTPRPHGLALLVFRALPVPVQLLPLPSME